MISSLRLHGSFVGAIDRLVFSGLRPDFHEKPTARGLDSREKAQESQKPRPTRTVGLARIRCLLSESGEWNSFSFGPEIVRPHCHLNPFVNPSALAQRVMQRDAPMKVKLPR